MVMKASALFALMMVIFCSGQHQAKAQSALSGWPCYGNAPLSFKADYTADVGFPLNFPAQGRCAAPGSVATIDTGALPPGLTLTGLTIVGVPQTIGDFYFSVKYFSVASNKDGRDVGTFHIRVKAGDSSRTEGSSRN